jgi:hypothetical protein
MVLIGLAGSAGVARAQNPPETIEYYATDALGSVRVVFTPAGQVVGRSDYLPFGDTLNQSGARPKQRFTGQERDGDAGWASGGRMPRWLLYGLFCVVGGVLVAAAGLWWAGEYPDTNGAEIVSKWGGLILAGVVLVWDAVRIPHCQAQAKAFWATVALCIFGHLLVLALWMSSVASWRAVWWALVIPAEALVIRAIVRRFGVRAPGVDGASGSPRETSPD